MADYIRLEMRGKDSVCRLCLGENIQLLHVFESEGIHGWTAATAINELLRIEISEGDIYPQYICTECMQKLVDFKLFKQQCEINKDSLDLQYNRYREVGGYKVVMGTVLCSNENQSDLRIKEEDVKVPNDEDPLGLSGDENPIICEVEQSSDASNGISSTEVIVSPDQVVNSPCEDILHSDHCIVKEECLDIKAESDSNGSFEEDTPRVLQVELVPGHNYNTGLSKETTGCSSYMGDTTSGVHSSWQQNDNRGPIGVSRLSTAGDVIENEEVVAEPNPISSHTKTIQESFHVHPNVESEHKPATLTQCGDENSIISSVQSHQEIQASQAALKLIKSHEKFPAPNRLLSHTFVLSGETPLQCAECSGGTLGCDDGTSYEEMSYDCDECGKSYCKKSDLQRHIVTHSGVRPFKCGECDKAYYHRDHLRGHMVIHSGHKPFECNECSKAFFRKTDLKAHMIIHSGKRSFECPECHKMFSRKHQMEIHLRYHLGEKPYMCEVCSKTFVQNSGLTVHMLTHSGEKLYKCNECDRSFSSGTSLKDHSRTHTGERPFSCEECEKTFTQKSTLKKHVMAVHNKLRPYHCSICSKSFSRRAILRNHVMAIHSGERPHGCDQCVKAFRTKTALRLHVMNRHSEDKDKAYKCEECGKSFAHSASFSDHKKIHTGERPYSCDQCGKSFILRGHLRNHMTVHSGDKPYECSDCGKAFAQRGMLNVHARIHSAERPHKCDQCDRSFYAVGHLKDHLRSHSGEKTFKCNVCSKLFLQKSGLNRHLKRHSQEEKPTIQ